MKQEPAFSPHWEAATGPNLTSPPRPPTTLHHHPTQRHVTTRWQTVDPGREKNKKKEEKNNQRVQDKEKPQPLIFCPYFNCTSRL